MTNTHRDRYIRGLDAEAQAIIGLGPCATAYDKARLNIIFRTVAALTRPKPRGDEMMQEFRQEGLVK